jgi:hypothetical protein
MFSNARPALIELTPFSQSDARNYLRDQATGAGLRDLFAEEALDLLVVGTHGSPRSLRSIASLAYFFAASGGASQIRLEHVTSALIGRAPAAVPKTEEALFAMPHIDEAPANDEIVPQANAAPVPPAEPPAEGPSAASLPPFAQKLPETIWNRFTAPIEVRNHAEQIAPELDTAEPTSEWEDTADWDDKDEDLERPSIFNRKTLAAAVTMILLVIGAVAMLTPSMQANTNLASVPQTPRLASPAAAVQMPSVPAPVEPLPPDPPSEIGQSAEAAPVLPEPESAPAPAPKQDVTSNPPVEKTSVEASVPKAAPRRSLSPEELAAVTRGVEELQRSARRLEFGRR